MQTPNSPKEDGEAEEDWSGPTNKKGEPSQNIADYDDPFECPCTTSIFPTHYHSPKRGFTDRQQLGH